MVTALDMTRRFGRTAFLAVSLLFTNSAVLAANDTAKAQTPKAETATPNKKNGQKPRVLFETDMGKILIELWPDKAPVTVENFLAYVDDGFYNGTIFHRVIPGFVVQGGGFTYDFQRKQTRAPIVNESGNKLKNLQGTLSMARTNNPDSATSQFFINLVDNAHLDSTNGRAGYAVFAKVIEGFDAVKKIEKEPRGLHKRFPEAPNYAIRILKASRQ